MQQFNNTLNITESQTKDFYIMNVTCWNPIVGIKNQLLIFVLCPGAQGLFAEYFHKVINQMLFDFDLQPRLANGK